MAPDVCPHCGAEVPLGAKACPDCGSDESTGWSEEARYDNLNLPDENFDYDEFIKRELGPEPVKPHGVAWFWWMIAILVTISLICLWLR